MMAAGGWVMVGSAATSTACCLMPRARATPRAQANAAAMLTLMVFAATVPSPLLNRAGALILLTLAAGVGFGLADAGSFRPRVGPTRAVEGHRAVGSVLAAAALLLHQHAAAPGPVLLYGCTIAYLAWTLAAVIRPHTAMTPLLRWEHVAMATSLAAMVFATNHLAM
jgi:hypothetical protein